MNWNGNRETVDHLITLLSEPNRAAAAQADYNARRRSRVNRSLLTRPVFIPLSFEMAAAGQTSPYRQYTPTFNYDVVITGFKADTQTREIIVRREDEKSLTYVGDELNLFLRTDELAGQCATNGGGQLGVFYPPQPEVLQAGRRFSVEMFKTDTTVDAEEANIVLVGFRVFPAGYGALMLDDVEKQRIERALSLRDTPRVVFLKVPVDFDAAGAGGLAENIITPSVEEPLLVRGIRTTLRQSLVHGFRVQGEPDLTMGDVPVWGLAAEDELVHDNYQWFSRPIYLHSKTSIELQRITNSIDGNLIDAQTGNSITFLAETV